MNRIRTAEREAMDGLAPVPLAGDVPLAVWVIEETIQSTR
jgi:hypothetical protein